MVKISVIVPVYNVEKYLKKCIDSLINQSYKNLQLILVDDGSTDNSGNICDEYAQLDDRIMVIHKVNGGLVSARKTGVKYADGDYVTYVDSDDWIELDSYEILAMHIEKKHPDIVVFGYIKEYDTFSDKRLESLPEGMYYKNDIPDIIEKHLNSQNYFYKPIVSGTCCAKIIKKELLIEKQLLVDERMRIGEDLGVMYPCIWNANSVLAIDNCLYHYRVRNTSIVHTKNSSDYFACKLLIKHLASLLNESELLKDKILADNVIQQFIYCIYYNMLITAPEYILNKQKDTLLLYPKVKKDSKIVIYGNGVYAKGLVKYINQTKYCRIIECIDRSTKNSLINGKIIEFDYIIIALTISDAVYNIKRDLENMGIKREKIQYIKKNVLTIENLPDDFILLLNMLKD